MRKILTGTCIIILYNILLIILPIILFLAFTKWSNPTSLRFLIWIYLLFVLVSPLLSIAIGYSIIRDRLTFLSGFIPIILSFIGLLPFCALYRLLNSIWMPADYLFFTALPLLFGLIADFLAAASPVFKRMIIFFPHQWNCPKHQ